METPLKKYASTTELLTQFYANSNSVINDWQYILDVDKLCSFLGIKLVKINTSTEYVGKVEQNKNGEAIITINMDQNQYTPRYRFTVAHEIAHYNLHLPTTVGSPQEYRDDELTMFRKEDNWNRQEIEANNFAAELLMPSHKIDQAMQEILQTVQQIYRVDFTFQMAEKFQVSNMAMEYRLIKLGILTSK